jgi:replication factor A1
MAELNAGFLKKIFAEEQHFTGKTPVTVQVGNIKPIPNETGKRLRLLLSDGVYSAHAVVRPECVVFCEENGLKKTGIVTLVNYDLERMGASNKHVFIISELVINAVEAPKIGSNIEPIDEYFKEHPEEDRFNGSNSSETTPVPQEQPAQRAEAPKPASQAAVAAAPQTQAKKPANIYAIDQLSPYQTIWTIKARVSYKGDLRTWSNQRGEGKLFNVNFLDETDEIRATAFNDQADKFYNLLQENKVYYISKARIQPSKPQFSNLKHPYELSLDRDTIVEECLNTDDVPKLHYNFVKLDKIQNLEADSIIDVVGVLKEVNPQFQITSKAGRAYDRRDITIVDDSQFAITIGLWNKTAIDFSIPEGSVIAVKGAKVSDFNGKTLSLTPSSTVAPNPDTPEAYTIKGWYDAQGKNGSFQSLKTELTARKTSIADRKSIEEVQQLAEIGLDDKPQYFSIKASINYVKTDNFSYPACLTEGCNRKVVEQHDGTWRCEKCDINHAVPKHRYILACSVLDPSGQLWLTLFDDQASALLETPADDLVKYKDEDPAQFSAVISKIQMHEYDFRIRGRQENYNGVSRVRYNAANINKIDYSNESDFLVSKFESLLA